MAYTIPNTEAQADDLGQLKSHATDLLNGYHQAGLDDLQDHAQGLADDLTKHAQSTAAAAQATLQTGLSSLQDHAQSLVDDFSAKPAPSHALDLQSGTSQRSGGALDMAPPSPPTGSDTLTDPLGTSGSQPPAAPVDPNDLHAYARSAATKAGIDPDIFERQIQQESGFRTDAGSPAGAQGIAQFMPDTAKGLGVDVTDPRSSLDGAARLMAQNLQKYNGDYSKALAAYNAGGGAVDKYGGVPPFEETQRYVSTIMNGKSSPPSPRNPDRAPDPASPDPLWLSTAKDQLGKPYIWGSGSGTGGRGTQDIDPATGSPRGFDCSGFVSYVYKNAFGIDLPAQTASAYAATTHIDQADARPGDIVEFNMDSNDPHEQHIGIYLGGNKVIQAGGIERNVNIGAVDQFGAGSFQFRRAAGADTTADNHAARSDVADLANHPIARTPVRGATTAGQMQSATGALDLDNPNPRPQFDPQGQNRRDSLPPSPDQLPQFDPQGQNARDNRPAPNVNSSSADPYYNSQAPAAPPLQPDPPAPAKPTDPTAWDAVQDDAARLLENLRAKGDPLAADVAGLKDRIDQAVLTVTGQGAAPAPHAIVPPGPAAPDARYPQAPPWLVTPRAGSPLDRSIQDPSTQLTGPEQLSAGLDTYRGATASRNEFISQNNPIANLKNANGDPMFGAAQVAALTSGLAGLAVDPSTYVVGGPIKSVVESALGRVATQGEIGALEQVVQQGAEGGLFGTHTGLQDPNATPESVAGSAAQMAAGNIGLHLAGQGARAVVGSPGVRQLGSDAADALRSRSGGEVNINAALGGIPGMLEKFARYPDKDRAGLEDFAKQQVDAGVPIEQVKATLTEYMDATPPPAAPTRGPLGGARDAEGNYVRPDPTDTGPAATPPEDLMATLAASIEAESTKRGRPVPPEIQARIDGAETAQDLVDTARRAGVPPDVVAEMQAKADNANQSGGGTGQRRYPDDGQMRLRTDLPDEQYLRDQVHVPSGTVKGFDPLDFRSGVMPDQADLGVPLTPAETAAKAAADAAEKARRLPEGEPAALLSGEAQHLVDSVGGVPEAITHLTALEPVVSGKALADLQSMKAELEAHQAATGTTPDTSLSPADAADMARTRNADIERGQQANLEPQLPTMADDVRQAEDKVSFEQPMRMDRQADGSMLSVPGGPLRRVVTTKDTGPRALASADVKPDPLWQPQDVPSDTATMARQAQIRTNRSMLEAKGGPSLDPVGDAAKAAEPPVQATVPEVIKHLVINNIIAGPATGSKLILNSIFSPVLHSVGATAGDLSIVGRRGLRRPEGDRVVGRIYGTAYGYARAGQEVAANISDVVRRRNTGSTMGEHFADPHWIGNRLPDSLNNRAVKGVIAGGDVVGGAFHQMLQTATATIVRYAELGAAAGEMASDTKVGSSVNWGSRMSHLVEHPEELPTQAVRKAIDTGSDAALRRRLGSVGEAFGKYVHDSGAAAVMPITRIPMAATSKVMEFSPFGAIDALLDVSGGKRLLGMSRERAMPYAEPRPLDPNIKYSSPEAMRTAQDAWQAKHDAWQGNETYGQSTTPLELRLQHSLTGTALAAWLISKSGETSNDPKEHPYGWVTGSGPDNGDDRKKLEMFGWKADSVWVPGVGYRAFRGFHGVSAPLAAAGNWHDAAAYGAHGGNSAAFFQDLAGRMTAFVADETLGLPQIAMIHDMMADGPGRAQAFGRFLGSTVSNDLLPAPLRAFAASSDEEGSRAPETLRDRTASPDTSEQARTVAWNTFLGTVSEGIPGRSPNSNVLPFREDVPLQRDALGRPVPNASQGLNVFLPKGNTATADPTGIVKAFVDADVNLPSIPTTVYTPNDAVGMDLTPPEARQLQIDLGDRVTDLALGRIPGPNGEPGQKIINGPEWAGYSTETKHNILSAVLNAARKSVEGEFLSHRSTEELRVKEAGGRFDLSHGARVPVKNPKYPDETP